MTNDLTALVVLRPGAAANPADPRAAETPPRPGVAAHAVTWFAGHGFQCGPVVGISFAITAPAALFDAVFGVTPGSGEPDLPLDRVDADLAASLLAITTTPPPDFGPGNP